METAHKKTFDYKWVIVALCFVMVFVCQGFCSGTKSLYLAAITDALSIKRSLFSLSDSCRFVFTAVINLFFGTLISKFGARKMIGAGFSSLIISLLINAYAKNVFHFCIGGCFLGMGLSWTTTTMVGHVVNRWCKEHRGTIMGFVLAANGVGAALATQIITPIIYVEGDIFGYRNAYKLMALILGVVGVIVFLLFRDDLEHNKSGEVNVQEKKHKNASWRGISFKEMLQMPHFCVTMICVFVTGIVLEGLGSTTVAHMKDVGLDVGYVATVMSIYALALAGFKFFSGVLHDHIGLKKTMLICYVASVLALLLLASLTASNTGKIFAMIYGFLSALAKPLETIMLPLLTADLFGEKAYSKLLGIIVSVNTVGYILGGPIFNYVFDLFGTYRPILLIAAVTMIVVALSVMQTLSAESKKKKLSVEMQ